VVLAIGGGYMVFRVGDLGAKAVWEGRLQSAHGGFPGGPESQLFAPGKGEGAP
jgi:hypothetical protein